MIKSDSRLLFLAITALMQLMGLGLVLPSFPNLIRNFATDHSQISLYFSLFLSLYAVAQFLSAPLLGALSDQYGRKPILLISLFIASCDYLFMTLAPNITALLIFRLIAGLCAANVTICMAYASDISTSVNRGIYFSTISAAFGLGLIIGPAIGAVLSTYHSYYPFYAASILYLLNFLFGLFILPESLNSPNRRKVQWSKINPYSNILKLFTNKKIAFLCLVYFLIHYCAATNPALWSLYTEYRFGWTAKEIGLSLSLVGVLTFLSQAFLARFAMPRFGHKKVLQYSLLGNVFSYCFFALADNTFEIILSIFFLSFFFLALPAVQAIISQKFMADEQGELHGSLVSLNSLSTFLNPLISVQLFSYFSWNYNQPGAPYYFAGLISLALFFGVTKFNSKI